MVFAAVKDCEISILPPVLAVEGVTSITVVTPESQNVKVNKKGVYSGDINIVVSGATFNGLNQVNPATIKISPDNSRKEKVDNKKVICVGDQGQTTEPVTFQTGQTSAQSIIQIMITDAGQDKMKVV